MTMTDETTEDAALAEDMRIIAYHEAGHMLAALAFGHAVVSFTLATAPEHRVVNGHVACEKITSNTIHGARMQMVIMTAGPAGELAAGGKGEVDDDDLRNATRMARKIHGLGASSDTIHSEVNRAWRAARRLLLARQDDLCEIAVMLLQNHETMSRVQEMTRHEIDELIGDDAGEETDTPAQEHDHEDSRPCTSA